MELRIENHSKTTMAALEDRRCWETSRRVNPAYLRKGLTDLEANTKNQELATLSGALH